MPATSDDPLGEADPAFSFPESRVTPEVADRVADDAAERREMLTALRTHERRGDVHPGMLILEAGAWRLRATLSWPVGEAPRYREIDIGPAEFDSEAELYEWDEKLKRVWRNPPLFPNPFPDPSGVNVIRAVHKIGFRGGHFGAHAPDNAPLWVTLRIPLTARAVLRVFDAMTIIASMPKSDYPFLAPMDQRGALQVAKQLVEAVGSESLEYLVIFESALFEKLSNALTPLDWTYQLALLWSASSQEFNRGALRSAAKSLREAGCKNPSRDGDFIRRLTRATLYAAPGYDWDWIDIAASGVGDPVFLNILDCQVRRELLSDEIRAEFSNVIHRSQYARIASRILDDKFGNIFEAGAPKFFSALHHATYLLGVGFIDAAESVKEIGWLKGKLAEWFIFETSNNVNFPDLADRAEKVAKHLRGINAALFDNTNRPTMIKLLQQRKFFDPLSRGVEVRSAREFDLRMVLAEQKGVEDYLNKLRPVKAQFKIIDNHITHLVNSMLSMGVQKKYQHPQSLVRLSGLLIDFLDEDETKKRFENFRWEGYDYVFERKFSNYWWRVAAGSAHIFVLHAGNAPPESLKEEYLAYLERALGDAPAGTGRGSKVAALLENLATVRATPEETRTDDGDALRAALPLVDPSDGAAGRKWWGCSDGRVSSGTMEGVADRRHVLGELAEPAHATSLAAAWESAAGRGATDNAHDLSGLPDAMRPMVCKAIEARRSRTACLLSGKKDCVKPTDTRALLGMDDGGATLLKFDDPQSVRLRSRLPELWPFLSLAIRSHLDEGSIPGSDDLVAETLARRDEWLIALERTRILANAQPDAAEALGFDAPSVYRALYLAATGEPEGLAPGGSTPCDDAPEGEACASWLAEAEKALAPASVRARIVANIDPLREVSRRVSELRGEVGIAPYPTPRLAVDRESRRRASGRDEPGIGFDLISTDRVAPDGRRLHKAVAMFRPPRPPSGTGGAEGFPIGVEIHDVAVEADGSLRQVELKPGRSNVDEYPDAGRALFSTFGVPELFADAHIRYEISPDLRDLSVVVRPKLLDRPLPEFSLYLIQDGEGRLDLDAQLIDGLETSVKGAASDALRELLEPLLIPAMTIPDIGNIELALCEEMAARLDGLDTAPEHAGAPPPLRVELDVCMSLLFTLSGDDSPLRADASASVILDANGLKLSRFEFDPDSAIDDVSRKLSDALTSSVKGLLPSKYEKHANVKIRLLTGSRAVDRPSRDGVAGVAHALRLAIDLTVMIGDPNSDGTAFCPIPLDHEVSLANLQDLFEDDGKWLHDGIEKIGETAINAAVDCATSLAIETAASSINEALHDIGREINLFGDMTLQIEETYGWNSETSKQAKCETSIPADGKTSILANVVAHVNGTTWPINCLGIAFGIEDRTLSFVLKGMPSESRTNLGEVALAQLRALAGSVFGEGSDNFFDFDEVLTVEHPEVGETPNGALFFYADVSLNDLPYFGDVSLGRMNFANLQDRDQLKEAVRNWAIDKAAKKLGKKLAGEVHLEHVGSFALKDDCVEWSGSHLVITGKLTMWQGIAVGMSMRLPLPGLDGVEFDMEEDSVNESLMSVLMALKDLVPFAGDRITLEAPRFVEITPGSGRYGIALGAKINFAPLDIELEAERIIVGIDGITLAGAISGRGFPPIELGAGSLTNIGATYYPGHLGEESQQGLVIEADIVPGTAEIAKIVKVDAQLDLSELGKLRLTMNGDLVVFGTFPLLLATGEVDLAQAALKFDVKTASAIEKILSSRSSAWLGKVEVKESGCESEEANPAVGTSNTIEVFGAEILEAKICADIPVPGSADPGSGSGSMLAVARMESPIGGGGVEFNSDLNFGSAKVKADVELRLLKWKALGASIEAESGRASAKFTVLFVDMEIGAPAIDRLGKRQALAAVRGAFDTPLEELAEIDPDRQAVKMVTVGKNGAVSVEEVTAHERPGTERAAASDKKTEADPPSEPAREEPPKTEPSPALEPEPVPAPEPEPDPAPEPEPEPEPIQGGRVEAQDMDFGFGADHRAALYCHRVIGDRFELRADRRDVLDPETFGAGWSHPHDDIAQLRAHEHHDGLTFRWKPDAAGPPCHEESWEGPNLPWNRDWVPVGMAGSGWPSQTTCDDGAQRAPRVDVAGTPGAPPKWPDAIEAKRALFCWNDPGRGYLEARGELFMRQDTDKFAVLVLCPAPVPGEASEQLLDDDVYRRVCGADATHFVELRLENEHLPAREGRLNNIVGARDAYRLFEHARLRLLSDEGVMRISTVALEDGAKAHLYLYPDDSEEGVVPRSLSVLAEDSDDNLIWAGHIDDLDLVRYLASEMDDERGAGETPWSRLVLSAWRQDTIDRSAGHPNERRPCALFDPLHDTDWLANHARRGGAALGWMIASSKWSCRAASSSGDIALRWSWRPGGAGEPETRILRLDSVAPSPAEMEARGRREAARRLWRVLSRDSTRLDPSGEWRVRLRLDKHNLKREILAYLPAPENDSLKLVLAPPGRAILSPSRPQTADWFAERDEYTRCGPESGLEKIVADAHLAAGGEELSPGEFDLREWLNDPVGTAERLGLAYRPTAALEERGGECGSADDRRESSP